MFNYIGYINDRLVKVEADVPLREYDTVVGYEVEDPEKSHEGELIFSPFNYEV